MTIKSHSFRWLPDAGFTEHPATSSISPSLVIVFASADLAGVWREPLRSLAEHYPDATIIGCSSAGGILGETVHDGALVGLAIQFEHTRQKVVSSPLTDTDATKAAQLIAAELLAPDLKHVFVLSDGVAVNGSEIATGLHEQLGDGVLVTGGLAGDEARFEKTFTFHNQTLQDGGLVVLGLYGERIRVGHGSMGGWDPFGPMRRVTRSKGNQLFELDNSSALELYRRYLGPYAEDLPASGLKFPLSIRATDDAPELVRTLLAIDDERGGMMFAGDIPEGSWARLMRANFDRLVDGSQNAASISRRCLADLRPQLAILISCVGRKLVLGDRIGEEVEVVRDVIGDEAALLGFYSYGELCPASRGHCELHNQTMTITTLAEE